MIQPKYNPQEALERVKLLMKYDSSKTLTENKQQINEFLGGPIARSVLSNPAARSGLVRAFKTVAKWVAGSAILAPATLTGVVYWINHSLQGNDSFQKTKDFFNGCKTNIKSLETTVPKSEYRNAADIIYRAITRPWYEGATDNDAIRNALLSMPTVADLCALNAWYKYKYGDLYDDLDSDIDGQDFVTYVWSAIVDQITKAKDELEEAEAEAEAQADVKAQEKDAKEYEDSSKTEEPTSSTPNNTPISSTSGYQPCFGTYRYGCYAPAIAEVQRCLGIVDDSKFGPKTYEALRNIGVTQFNDSDVDIICGQVSLDDGFEPYLEDEEAIDILNT